MNRAALHTKAKRLRLALSWVDGALLLVVGIWGANFVVMKAVFSRVDPLAFNTVRLSLATLVLLGLLRMREGSLAVPKPDALRLAGLGLVGHTFYQWPFILGLALTRAENSSLLIATIPLWAALLAWALRWERLSARLWAWIGLAFLGVALVTAGTPRLDSSGTPASLWGDLLTLAAAVSWAGYTVFSKGLLQRYSPLRVTALSLVPGVVALWLVSWPQVMATDWRQLDGWAWGAMAYSGALSIAVAYVLWALGVQRVGAARTAVYNNLVPVVTFAVAYWVWQQPISLWQGLGGAVVLAGVALTQAQHQRQ